MSLLDHLLRRRQELGDPVDSSNSTDLSDPAAPDYHQREIEPAYIEPEQQKMLDAIGKPLCSFLQCPVAPRTEKHECGRINARSTRERHDEAPRSVWTVNRPFSKTLVAKERCKTGTTASPSGICQRSAMAGLARRANRWSDLVGPRSSGGGENRVSLGYF